MQQLERKTPPALQDIKEAKLPEVQELKLDNGISVYVVNSGNNPPMLKVELLFEAGNIRQQLPLQARTTSKLLFDGTKNKNARQIAEAFDYYGAYTDCDHGDDVSSISLYVLNEYLEQTLPILLEVMTEASFPEQELEIFKQIGKQGLAIKRMKTSYLASTQFNHLMYGNHPYGVIIDESNYDALDTEHLKYFYGRYFDPGTARIIISGHVYDKEIQLLNNFFGKLSARHSEAVKPNPVHFNEGKVSKFVEKEDALQATICAGIPVINRDHPEFRELLLMNLILGGYFGSRLMKNIREEKGYTYGIHSSIRAMRYASIFVTQTDVRNEVHNKTLDEIVKEISILQSEPVGEKELRTSKNYLIGHFVRGLDGDFSIADKVRQMLVHGLSYDYYNSYVPVIRNVKAEKIMELANKYIRPEAMLTVIAGKSLEASNEA